MNKRRELKSVGIQGKYVILVLFDNVTEKFELLQLDIQEIDEVIHSLQQFRSTIQYNQTQIINQIRAGLERVFKNSPD